MKVAIIGLRGFPEVQGGVEKHVESLAPLIVRQGFDVTVYVRAPYMRHYTGNDYHGVRLCRIWCPVNKFSETVIHTFLSVLVAAIQGNRVVHLQAIGPAGFAPLARLLGMRVIMTHHGCDYQRQKWGRFPRGFLRLCERLGVRSSHRVIAISRTIQRFLLEQHQCSAELIPNGVSLFPDVPMSAQALEPFGLEPGRYVLHVGRFVPEKRHHDLIDAFKRAGLAGWKLAFAGAADHDDRYSAQVMARAADDVLFLGRQPPRVLAQLYGQCGLFALPSSHEGLPISLLEAMSLNAPFVVSDIDPHTELGLPAVCVVPLGDIDALAARLRAIALAEVELPHWPKWADWVRRNYNWDAIAVRTAALYRPPGWHR